VFEDYQITFEQRTFLQTALKDGLRTNDTKVLPLQGKNLRLTSTLFDNDAIVLEKGQVKAVALVSTKSGRAVTMKCEGWPYFGIWSKKGNREFVCLEPWYGIADHVLSEQQLEKKEGIIRLDPEGRFSCSFQVQIT
jgi:galactose mutarotase-like enzyme